MKRIGQFVATEQPRGQRRTEKRELAGIGRKWLVGSVAAVDTPRSLRREKRVLEDYVADLAIVAGNFVDVDFVFRAAVRDVDRGERFGTVEPVKGVIRGRNDRSLPALLMQRDRQVVNDVCYATDLATGERAILGGCEYNVLGTDDNLPSV